MPILFLHCIFAVFLISPKKLRDFYDDVIENRHKKGFWAERGHLLGWHFAPFVEIGGNTLFNGIGDYSFWRVDKTVADIS